MTDLLVVLFIIAGVAGSIIARKLTIMAALTGGLLAWLLYKGTGITGVVMLGVFFIAGSVVTAVGAKTKEQLGMAESNKGQRSTGQVMANGGVAALAGLLAWCYPFQSIAGQLMAAAALASAAADTCSSELGSLYGKRFYNILTFKKDQRGLNGVVSLEGTLLGVAGSALIAMVYSMGYGYSIHALFIVLAGTAGNLADSVLGAAFERHGRLTNDLVNVLNTLIAAVIVFVFYRFL
jgi:uncharacterized protein (TIGR00297 family)